MIYEREINSKFNSNRVITLDKSPTQLIFDYNIIKTLANSIILHLVALLIILYFSPINTIKKTKITSYRAELAIELIMLKPRIEQVMVSNNIESNFSILDPLKKNIINDKADPKLISNQALKHNPQLDNYETALANHLEKYRPFDLVGTDIAVIKLKINNAGYIIEYNLVQNSGNDVSDQAIIHMVEQANPYPCPPSEHLEQNGAEYLIPIAPL